jgi:hypothetical protein
VSIAIERVRPSPSDGVSGFRTVRRGAKMPFPWAIACSWVRTSPAVSLFPFGIEDERVGIRVDERLGHPSIIHSECEDQRSQCKCRSEVLTGSLFLSHDFVRV